MSGEIFILAGICGSTAHGLAHEDSDEDIHGVFSHPTHKFWQLNQPRESIVTTDPDTSYHELSKWLKLAAGANPQVLELLWLESYLKRESFWGSSLLALRESFLSADRVAAAYGGYADSQFKALNARGETFSSGTRNRTFKHAKHMFRLLEQGQKLLETGELSVKVDDRDWYLNVMPEMTLDQIKAEFKVRFTKFNEAKSVLPDKPDWDSINTYLYEYRRNHIYG